MGFFGWVFYCQPCEKALPEIDKRLNVELELRKLARKEGRRYCDPVALTYQSERMPEPLRSKVGQVPTVQVQAALWRIPLFSLVVFKMIVKFFIKKFSYYRTVLIAGLHQSSKIKAILKPQCCRNDVFCLVFLLGE